MLYTTQAKAASEHSKHKHACIQIHAVAVQHCYLMLSKQESAVSVGLILAACCSTVGAPCFADRFASFSDAGRHLPTGGDSCIVVTAAIAHEKFACVVDLYSHQAPSVNVGCSHCRSSVADH